MEGPRSTSPLVWIALCAAIVSVSFVLRRPPAPTAPTAVSGDWQTGWLHGAAGFNTAAREASARHQPILLYFHASWCGACKQLEARTLPRPEVIGAWQNMQRVELNPDRDPEEKAIEQRYGVRAFPSMIVIRDGTPREVPLYRYINGSVRWTAPSELATLF